MVKIFGIRHHGPGSAKTLVKALESMQPDIILIEGAEELDELLPYVGTKDLIPPVAALIYNPKDLQQAVYYPFTEFSPEWQAFLYAKRAKISVVQMDLPQGLSLGLEQVPEKMTALQEAEDKDISEDLELIVKDPLGYMARLAGYEDSERWWEIMFEQNDGSADVFEEILELMQTLRQEIGNRRQASNLLREAYMRKTLRQAIKDGYQRIAVICGAWHGPALADLNNYKEKDDNALLKGIPKIKTKATWIPWTYDRISFSSGYGAGVLSPAWYELLFHHRSDASIRWMSKVSQLFKDEDLGTSSAHAIEAVRLAESLATLRGLELPGIEELSEAVVTIFSGGYNSQLELIQKKLIIGEKMGEVPDSIPTIPLQQDLDENIKNLKLTKYKKAGAEWIKASSTKPKGGLDLRQEHDLKQSQFLHRLYLLGIQWGLPDSATGKELSTKNEYWKMEWKPEFALQIIEAGMWGNTVEQAAIYWVIDQSKHAQTLADLTTLLQKVIHANLPEALDELVQELRNLAAITQDITHLMKALPSLVFIQRYGDVRNTEIGMVNALIHELIPRICVSLPSASVALDDQAGQLMFEQILSVNKALALLDDESHSDLWNETIEKLATNDSVYGQIRGAATRILLNNEIWEIPAVADAMSFALSKSVDISTASNWIEGFLHGSGLLLIHNPILWQIVDDWLCQLQDEAFQELLPSLRRTFARFSPVERQKMLQMVKNGVVKTKTTFDNELDKERMEAMLGTLRVLLG